MATITATGTACIDCTLLLANDEYTNDEHINAMTTTLAQGPAGMVVVTNDEHEDFSTTPCDTCGSTLAGERHGVAWIL